jgi:DNA repair protein RAD50
MDTTQVKAQVKLRFTSSNSQTMVVVRSMEVTQKKTQATFKQLDGALRTFDTMTGERVTLSHKCSELDKQIPTLLGVSKPILDHVLFCHQEDSSWPLAEASVLKKRFDEIFDSSRYTKAIGIFRQLEKDFTAQVKELMAEKAGLTSHQHAAHGFRKELSEANEAEEELDDDKKRIDTQLAQVQETMEELQDIAMRVSTVEGELDAAQQEKTHQMSLVIRLRSMLEDNLTQQYSLRELEKMLRDYDVKVSTQQEEWQDLKDRDTEYDQAILKLRRKETELTQEKARLDADRETYEKNCRDRYQLTESIAQSYNVDLTQGGGSVNMSMDAASFVTGAGAGADFQSVAGLSQGSILQISAEDMQAVMEMLHKKEEELKSALQETIDMHQANEDKLLKDLAELKASRSTIEAGTYNFNVVVVVIDIFSLPFRAS